MTTRFTTADILHSLYVGTKMQQTLKKTMTQKQLLFKRKWSSFKTQVDRYNEIQPVSNLPCPTLEEAKSLDFEDTFWNVGPLSHPSEKWAVDPKTKEGIQAFLMYRSCGEELRRIGRETRQMVLGAFHTEEKLDGLLTLCNSGKSVMTVKPDYDRFENHLQVHNTGWDAEDNGRALIDLVQPGQRISKDVWLENVVVLEALHNNLRQRHCRNWNAWNSGIASLLRRTLKYTGSAGEANEALIVQWEGLIGRGMETWNRIVNANSVQATTLDDLEIFEQNMMVGENDEDDGDQLQPEENENDSESGDSY